MDRSGSTGFQVKRVLLRDAKRNGHRRRAVGIAEPSHGWGPRCNEGERTPGSNIPSSQEEAFRRENPPGSGR
jgi:hypothetical protein